MSCVICDASSIQLCALVSRCSRAELMECRTLCMESVVSLSQTSCGPSRFVKCIPPLSPCIPPTFVTVHGCCLQAAEVARLGVGWSGLVAAVGSAAGALMGLPPGVIPPAQMLPGTPLFRFLRRLQILCHLLVIAARDKGMQVQLCAYEPVEHVGTVAE